MIKHIEQRGILNQGITQASKPPNNTGQLNSHSDRSLNSMSVLHLTLLGILVTGVPVSSFMDPSIWRSSLSVFTIERGRAAGHVPSRKLNRLHSESSSIPPEAERELMKNLPDDPVEIDRLEREYYYKQKEFARLSKLRREMENIPKHRQCHRYRWRQTETTFDVEIPMLAPVDDEDLWLVLKKDQLQVAIRRDESFGAITGFFTGVVDPSKSSFRQHLQDGEPYLHLTIQKVANPGTYEFWKELLVGEVESPTIRFAGETERYRWKQNAETVEIPVPEEVSKRRTALKLDPSGSSMRLSFSDLPEFEPLEGKFKGFISPLDSVWMLDEGDTGKILALTVKKRREADDCTAWWSGVLEGDDKW